MHLIPAAFAAMSPRSESSITRHSSLRKPLRLTASRKEFNVLFFGQRNADSRKRLLCSKEVEALRIHEYAVVIPEGFVDPMGLSDSLHLSIMVVPRRFTVQTWHRCQTPSEPLLSMARPHSGIHPLA